MTDERAFAIARAAVNDQEAAQKIEELAGMIDYLIPKEPKVILEIGSWKGGTLWAWRKAFPEARIIAIDPLIVCPSCDIRKAHSDCPRDRVRQNATTYIQRRSDDGDLIKSLPAMVGSAETGRGIDFHFIDGDHSPEAVDNDFGQYTPFLSADGVIALHDILYTEEPGTGVGPSKLWHNVHTMKLIPQSFEICSEPLNWGGFGVIPKPSK